MTRPTGSPATGATDSAADSLLGRLADEFLEARQRGAPLDVETLAADHPQAADVIRRTFPALAALRPAPAAASLPAEELGDFRLVRELGRGGMGVVYEAVQQSLGRRVALKVLPLAGVLDEQRRRRFQHEAQAAGSLQHPHIVPVYEIGCERGVHYYAMQLIQGVSLATAVAYLRAVDAATGAADSDDAPAPRWLRRMTSTADRSTRVAVLGVQAAQALHYAHEMGVVHRDVKPSNLLIDRDGWLYVADFGLAWTAGGTELTRTGDILGTLRYMSPEQASGRRTRVDRRTDVYSLGACLYEMATLRPAFCDENRVQLLQQIICDEPRRPRQLDRTIPKDLETIIVKAMAKEPHDRYASAQAVADDLTRFIHGEPIEARRSNAAYAAYRWCRRHQPRTRFWAAIAAVLLVLLIVGPLAAIRQGKVMRLADRELRAKKINQLYQDWFAGAAERVGDELGAHFANVPTDEYLFEWEWLRQQYDESRAAIILQGRRLGGFAKLCAFSPDSRWLACGQPTGRVALYDTVNRKWRPLDDEAAREVAHAAFTPDGRELLTVSWTGVLRRLDVASGTVVGPVVDCGAGEQRKKGVDLFSWNQALDLSADGRMAAIGMQTGTVALVRLDDGVCQKIAAHESDVRTVAFALDGSALITSAGDNLVKLWDLGDHRLIRAVPCRAPTGVLDMKALPDGRRLLLCHSEGVRLMATPELTEVRVLQAEPQQVRRVALHRDEILATAGIDGKLTLWDLASGLRLLTIHGHQGTVGTLSISPDGKLLASGAPDGTIRLWPVGRRIDEARQCLANSQPRRTELQFVDDGRRLISSSREFGKVVGDSAQVCITGWNLATASREPVGFAADPADHDVTLLPDQDGFLVGGIAGLELRSRNGALVRRLDANPLRDYRHVAVSSDGRWAAGAGYLLDQPLLAVTSSDDPMVKTCFVALYDLQTNQSAFFPLPTTASTDRWSVRSIALSPDSRFLITGGGDGDALYRVDEFEQVGGRFRHVRVEEIPRGRMIGEVYDVAISADSRWAGVVGRGGYCRIWSLRGAHEVWLPRRKSDRYAVAFSPDGRLVAMGDATSIELCDLASQEPLAQIPMECAISDLQFSPDGQSLAWAALDGRVGMLNAAPRPPSGERPKPVVASLAL